LVIRDNQIEVYNKDGDLISGKEGGSIMGGVKGACALSLPHGSLRGSEQVSF
jgi:hypothetical protein